MQAEPREESLQSLHFLDYFFSLGVEVFKLQDKLIWMGTLQMSANEVGYY